MMTDKILVMVVRFQNRCAERDRRTEHRLLCSNLVKISWVESNDRRRKETAVLENISRGGLGLALFVSVPLEIGTALSVLANGIELRGLVRQCSLLQNGYIVGLELDENCVLTAGEADSFTPEHLIDLDQLSLK
jgi:hypothetical protein